MKIVLIGAGNVATHLGQAFKERGLDICQVYSRTESNARQLAEKINSAYTADISHIVQDADIYIYSVSDDALPLIIKATGDNPGLHIHTSGSTSVDIFKGITDNYGVMYPLQTFSKNKNINFSEVPFFIEGNSNYNEERIYRIASCLSSKLYMLDSVGRLKLHVSAVFACNFVNHFYEVGSELVGSAGVPFDVLFPLIEETFEKIKVMSPFDAQTGPAVRNDRNIISRHIDILKETRNLSEIYSLISEDIYRVHKQQKN